MRNPIERRKINDEGAWEKKREKDNGMMKKKT